MKSTTYGMNVQRQLLCGDAFVLSPAAQFLYLSLHYADPLNFQAQGLYEIKAVNRAVLARDSKTWEESSIYLQNAQRIIFPMAGKITQKIIATHWQIGESETGNGRAFLSGKLAQEQEIISGLRVEIPARGFRTAEV